MEFAQNPGQIYQDARLVEEGGQEKEYKDVAFPSLWVKKVQYISALIHLTPVGMYEDLGY